ncbi:MAG: hypothetical protein A2X94_04110 [Bdellovibrionales bacterium GWB1_55_8]|nr:MAG: hypothetical protein A2X94_04110 [Bdellovibrionales bacterium GWB1_55_8]
MTGTRTFTSTIIGFGLGFSLLWTGATAHAAPAEWNQASLIRSEKPGERVDGLIWADGPITVEAEIDGKSFQPVVRLKGTFSPEEWLLLHGETEVPRKNGQFTLTVPLQGEITPLRIYAINPFGELKNEKAAIVFSGWDGFGLKSRERLNPKDSVFVGLGASKITFDQTKTRGFDGTFITVKAAYQSTWKAPYLDYGFTGFVTAASAGMNREDISVRFLGVNARAGYAIASIREPWRLSLMGGVYYTTMIAPFGYKHVGGPMAYPVLRRVLSAHDTLSMYVKFSPISDGLSVLGLENRELAAGTTWTHTTAGGSRFSLSFDAAELSMTSASIVARSRSYSLSVSYGL